MSSAIINIRCLKCNVVERVVVETEKTIGMCTCCGEGAEISVVEETIDLEDTIKDQCYNCKKWFKKVWNETTQSFVIPNKCPHCGHCIGCD